MPVWSYHLTFEEKCIYPHRHRRRCRQYDYYFLP